MTQHPDSEMMLTQQAHRDMWARPDYRQNLRRDMLRDLFVRAADEGLLLTEWPVETLRYRTWDLAGPGREVPAALAESGDAPWETVEITLTAPARRGT